MGRMPLIRITICLLLVSGCAGFSGSPNTSADTSLRSGPLLVTYLQQTRSIKEIDDQLNDLIISKNAQERAEQLLSGWGQHGSWYDLAVVKFLLEHWPNAYSPAEVKEKFDLRTLFEKAQSVLRERPELCHQVSWYIHWKRGPVNSIGLSRHLLTAHAGCVKYSGQDYPWGLGICGLVEFDQSLLDVSPRRISFDNMEEDFAWTTLRIAAMFPYMRYSHERDVYILDREAFDENRYVDPKDQLTSPRLTPLPNWDSDIIPERPMQPDDSLGEELLELPRL